jgi:hypothetical protein
MLRTFGSNPALGGFGGESSALQGTEGGGDAAATPDAFCQIIKELVDNAVDACTVAAVTAAVTTATTAVVNGRTGRATTNMRTKAKSKNDKAAPATKRVRVVIERFEDSRSLRARSGETDKNETLRVTVSDNGCGMSDIEACVGAFHTSKAHNSANQAQTKAKHTASTTKASFSDRGRAAAEAQTAGRYGIGLTLCLLHAQRLVPDSCASIQSAVPSDREWTVVAAVVDTASDTVRCFPRESLAKNCPTESGTAISVLVPVRCSVYQERIPFQLKTRGETCL